MVKSKRDTIRDLAEALLRDARTPLHNSQIAEAVLAQMGMSGEVSPKTVNTSLHDDPLGRFLRVGQGTWTLKEFRR